MKVKWKALCFIIVLILDICFAKYMYKSYTLTKDTLFLPADADTEMKNDVRKQFSGEKPIALTFDDGPHSVYTPKLLDGLRKRGVHVTFFLLGRNVKGKEAIVRQMHEDGHLIGNHGYKHIRLNKETLRVACEDIEENNRQIEAITGVRPQYVRPPFGEWNEELECITDMTVVLWSVDTFDTLRKSRIK